MRTKRLLAAFLLGVGLCFVPVLGYGEVNLELYEGKASVIDFLLLTTRVNYMMANPTSFLMVNFMYDPDGRYERSGLLPKGVNTKGKIYFMVQDTRGVFFNKSGEALLNAFKRELDYLYMGLYLMATDMNTDIVATFHSREEIPLGYFYQGEYHLWEK